MAAATDDADVVPEILHTGMASRRCTHAKRRGRHFSFSAKGKEQGPTILDTRRSFEAREPPSRNIPGPRQGEIASSRSPHALGDSVNVHQTRPRDSKRAKTTTAGGGRWFGCGAICTGKRIRLQ